MKFCSECGHRVEKRVAADDPIPRFRCTHCHYVHYQNPKILVSCYATWEDKVLWIRRGTEPFKGKWAAPSGFMEENETLVEAAARELYEETRARVDMDKMSLHMVGNLTQMNQVYIVFHAPLLSPEFATTPEAEEARLLTLDEFPFDDFAFPEVVENVSLFYRDIQNQHFNVYLGTLKNGVNQVIQNDDSHLHRL
ncbi:NUDIX hydrolase [Aestuariicella hydrocarbonica]|uniref:NUDIX hydrolase n=1 Tax=Pseudomaricurvus hydrocarbonicus TaxID=1470433 RepID=A0A9E5MKY9_9GAMM|nr:NUDIX hydrolase [Aestuariicella hydrocarbonica]NHO66067.1 NUDIX hydrolase [Aestuariicella hydrocarbonica]